MEAHPFRTDRRPGAEPTVLTIGNFDGVHLGHQALIKRVVDEAAALGTASALLTFHPHPRTVLQPNPPPVVTGRRMRLRLFEQLGLDAAYLIPFTREFARTPPERFIADYLVAPFRLAKVIIGYDFQFGHNRAGTTALLEAAAREHGFGFEVMPPVTLGEERVSSSAVRAALEAADFARAERLLGRPYSVLEPVQRGEQRGRELGFPTLNQRPEERLPLAYGIYATRAAIRGRTYDAVSSYGVRPTVSSDTIPVLETYVFDFSGEVYGELVEVYPVHWLREERWYPDLESLRAQIAQDCDDARAALAGLGG